MQEKAKSIKFQPTQFIVSYKFSFVFRQNQTKITVARARSLKNQSLCSVKEHCYGMRSRNLDYGNPWSPPHRQLSYFYSCLPNRLIYLAGGFYSLFVQISISDNRSTWLNMPWMHLCVDVVVNLSYFHNSIKSRIAF